LPETEKLSTSATRNWLEKDTNSILAPVQNQAQKRLEEIRIAFQNLTESSQMLVDVSQKEIEKRNMKVYNRARALNKLAHLFVDRIKKLSIPDQVSYDLVNNFVSDAQKTVLVIDVDIKNWFPRISPFFIMDRRKFLPSFEKTKLTVNYLNDFVTKEYVKTKTLEKTFQFLKELESVETQLRDVETAKAQVKNERFLLEKEITTLEQQTAELRNKSELNQLCQVELEQETLNNELKNTMRHLQKPFIKMQALATTGGGAGITPDELIKLGEYLDNPFEALATEEKNATFLKEILEKLSGLMREDKLKLKPEKQRKAEQTVDELLHTNALSDLQSKTLTLAKTRKLLLNSPQIEEAKRNILANAQQMEKLKARHSGLEADEKSKDNIGKELTGRIQSHKKLIEANVLSFLGKQIHIT
jgi:hypothetical protein